MFDYVYERFFGSFDWPGLVFRDLSDRLNLSRDEGEKWIVNLIRETRMGADAKIDLEKVRCPFFSFSLLVFQLFDVIPKPSRAIPTWGSWSHFGLGLASLWMGGRWKSPALLDSYSAVGLLFTHAASDVQGDPDFCFRSLLESSPSRPVV